MEYIGYALVAVLVVIGIFKSMWHLIKIVVKSGFYLILIYIVYLIGVQLLKYISQFQF